MTYTKEQQQQSNDVPTNEDCEVHKESSGFIGEASNEVEGQPKSNNLHGQQRKLRYLPAK